MKFLVFFFFCFVSFLFWVIEFLKFCFGIFGFCLFVCLLWLGLVLGYSFGENFTFWAVGCRFLGLFRWCYFVDETGSFPFFLLFLIFTVKLVGGKGAGGRS